MLIEIITIGVGAWASLQDLREKKFNLMTVLASVIILLLSIYQNWPASAETALVGFAIGLLLQLTTSWQLGDTILLTTYSAVFMHPVLITLATVSTSFIPALFLAREKGKGATIPYAPFLTLGAVLVGGLT